MKDWIVCLGFCLKRSKHLLIKLERSILFFHLKPNKFPRFLLFDVYSRTLFWAIQKQWLLKIWKICFWVILKVLVLWHHNFKISNINMRNIGCCDHINKCNLFGITMPYEGSIMLNITHLRIYVIMLSFW